MKISVIFRSYPIHSANILAALIIIVCGLAIFASTMGIPAGLFRVTGETGTSLQPDQDISAWTRFDKPSYRIGELVNQELHVLYRGENIIPDIDSLRRRMSFFPLEQRAVGEQIIEHADGVTEHILNFELQAVRVDIQQTYQIDPFILYYTSTDQTDEQIYSQAILAPPVHIGAYYPDYLEDISLISSKGLIYTADTERRSIVILAGLLLLGLAALILWHFGRRRPVDELKEEERLWRVFASMESTELDNRTALLNYEQIFTRLLFIQTGVTPEGFWSGELPEGEHWKELTIEAKQLLTDNYQVPDPDDSEVERMKSLLSERLSSLVKEARLQIEQQPGFWQRISLQRNIIIHASVLTVIALGLISLSVVTDAWLSMELKNYNDITGSLDEDEIIEERTYLALSAMGDQTSNPVVKYNALFNAGTLRADNSFAMSNRRYENLILNTLIRSETVENLFHVLLEEGPFDEETQIVSVLINGAEQLRRSQLDLQSAVRVNPYDAGAGRNLEIVIKRRELVIRRLGEIRQFYRSQKEGEEQEALSDEGIINLLEAELPEDVEEEEAAGKDDRGYMILERF